MLFELRAKSSPINSTHYAKLYRQNGEPVVAIDSVTSFYPMYRLENEDVAEKKYAVVRKIDVTYDRSSVVVRRHCDTLCTSASIDDVTFFHNGPWRHAAASSWEG